MSDSGQATNATAGWRSAVAATVEDFTPARLLHTVAIGIVTGVILTSLTISLAPSFARRASVANVPEPAAPPACGGDVRQ